jgi:integrase/recombinase XerC
MAESAQYQSGLSKSILEYIDSLKSGDSFSPLTVRNYSLYLRRFSDFAFKNIPKPNVNNISNSLIDAYKASLLKMGLSVKTTGFHLIALRSFLKWERRNGITTLYAEEIIVPKTAGSRMEFLSGGDVEKLLYAPDLGTVQGKRDRAIMELIYSTGLRVSELAGLDKDNVDLVKKEIVIFKNNKKKRSIFLSLRALGWIENYLKSRKDKGQALFIHYKGSDGEGNTRLTVRSIQRAIVKYKRKVGIVTEVTPKTLRASFAVDLLMAGADTKSVQEMLGHKNISTTQIYAHVTNKQLRDVHTAFHGKGGK